MLILRLPIDQFQKKKRLPIDIQITIMIKLIILWIKIYSRID